MPLASALTVYASQAFVLCAVLSAGMRTQLPGATGVAQCLAPPGYELMADAAEITECAIGYYKQDWNRNNCTAVRLQSE